MVQATTLNVAFNSHNKSLLTIMMSNNVGVISTCTFISKVLASDFSLINDVLCVLKKTLPQFVEIKGSVFKKFEKNNLFQMSNSGKW